MKKKPEQTLAAPNQISAETFAMSMRRLLTNDDFKLLRAQWLNIRGEVLEAGKLKPSEAQWSVLRGFDLAVMEPERWAYRRTRDDDMKRRQEELLSILGGESK